MERHIPYKVVLILGTFLLFAACSPARYVGRDEYLLNRVKVNVEDKNISAAELKKAVRQRPNTRILKVVRFHLGLYNLSGRDEHKRFNQWLRSIGEAPVIYSPFLTERSVAQLRLYLNNKGYYNAEVSDSVWYKRKKAYVAYTVRTGPMTNVCDIAFRVDSSVVADELTLTSPLYRDVLEDSVHTLLRKNMPLDVGILEGERERITQMLRENGYFNFSRNFIQFYADTLVSGQCAKVMLTIAGNMRDSLAYRKYRIGNIRVNMDFNPLVMNAEVDSTYERTYYGEYEVLYDREMKIRPGVILATVQFAKGEYYDVRKVADSYARLQALNLFKFVNIAFNERNGADTVPVLDCEIRLTPMKRQSYNVFLEGTNNSGNIGVGGNFSYNHRNLFNGGENLTLSVWGALKKEKLRENEIFSTTEMGAELKLMTPQFWTPVLRFTGFRRDFAPKTVISLSYSQENTQFYRRCIASAKFGYLWKRANSKWRYDFDLVDLNYVMMPSVNEEFIGGLRNEYVKSAYTDHLILSVDFSTVYTDQVLNTPGNFNYFRGNLKSAGNFLLLVDRVFGRKRFVSGEESYHKALGVRYAQFVKADGEYRFNHCIDRINTVVYRLFLGCGYPYGNMKALPFEEAYYCGGANGIRAWQSRTLGPGAYVSEDKFPNNVGDFKLEANVEYRFKLFWILEGALFLDAGNVWNINRYENRNGTGLGRDFYKQIAVGTGMGLRLDVNFFLLRFDLGIKMLNPALPAGQRFVLLNHNGGLRESVFNIAIGYPF